jgi:hypothetical protein
MITTSEPDGYIVSNYQVTVTYNIIKSAGL